MDENVPKRVRHFAEAGKPIVNFRHGLQLQAAAEVLEAQTCTAYPPVRPEVERADARWAEAHVDRARQDWKLVTTPAWPAYHGWLQAFLGLLGTQITPLGRVSQHEGRGARPVLSIAAGEGVFDTGGANA